MEKERSGKEEEDRVKERERKVDEISSPKKGISGLAITSLVVAFLFAPLGLILGIIALKKTKKSNVGRGIAIVAVVISSLGTLVAIAGVVAAVVIPRISAKVNPEESIARVEVSKLASALEMYSLDCDSYPSGKGTRAPVGFDALVKNVENKSDWKGPYIDKFNKDVDGDNIPEDPWGNEYEYEAATSNAQSFAIWCKGEEGNYKDSLENDFKKSRP